MDTDTEPNRKYRKSGIGMRYRSSLRNGFGIGILPIPKYRKYRTTVFRHLSSLFQNAPYSIQHLRPKRKPQRTTTHQLSVILPSSYVVHTPCFVFFVFLPVTIWFEGMYCGMACRSYECHRSLPCVNGAMVQGINWLLRCCAGATLRSTYVSVLRNSRRETGCAQRNTRFLARNIFRHRRWFSFVARLFFAGGWHFFKSSFF